MKKALITAVVLLWLGLPIPARSGEPKTVMEEVVVTATRTEMNLEKVGGSTFTVITAADIRAGQQNTVEEILKGTPGIDVVANGGPGTSSNVFIRGADAKNTLVFLDGIMINDPSSTNRGANLANITADNIERIEIVRGPQSVLYGSNATAGVINIITKTGKGTPSVHAGVEGGSYGTWKFYAGTSGAVNDKLNWSVTASRTDTDGFSTADDDNDRIAHAGNTAEDDGWENLTLSGKVGLNFTSDFDVSGIVRIVNSEVDLDDYGPGYTGDRFGGWPTYAPEPTGLKDARADTREWVGRLSVHNFFFQRFFESTLYTQWADRQRTGYDNDGMENFDFNGFSREVGWQGGLNFQDVNILTFGFNLFKEEMDSASSSITNQDAQTNSIWLQDQWFIGDALVLVAGVRLDDHDRFGSKATYRIAPSYTLEHTGTTFRGTYGTGFRSPSLFELYSSYGNENLDPETSEGWDLGIEQRLLNNRIRFGLTYFELDFEDRIAWDSTRIIPGNFFPGGYNQMEGTTETQGIEAFVRISPISDLDLILNYTYTDTEDPDGQRLSRRPENKIGFNVRYRFLEKAVFNLDVQWVDDRDTITSARDAAGNPVETLDAFIVVNLAATYDVYDWLQVYGRIDNLFDEEYEEAWSYASPGLSGYLGIKVSY